MKARTSALKLSPSTSARFGCVWTQTGRALRAKAEQVPGCILDATGLSADKAKQLQNGITALRDALKSYGP
jgi:hypothetical protein